MCVKYIQQLTTQSSIGYNTCKGKDASSSAVDGSFLLASWALGALMCSGGLDVGGSGGSTGWGSLGCGCAGRGGGCEWPSWGAGGPLVGWVGGSSFLKYDWAPDPLSGRPAPSECHVDPWYPPDCPPPPYALVLFPWCNTDWSCFWCSICSCCICCRCCSWRLENIEPPEGASKLPNPGAWPPPGGLWGLAPPKLCDCCAP